MEIPSGCTESDCGMCVCRINHILVINMPC
ncbi:MAG: 2Fe-2S iron-sulfur cluster-binding protein [Thiotrichaceae bacterium]